MIVKIMLSCYGSSSWSGLAVNGTLRKLSDGYLRNALLFGGTSPFTTLAALIIPAIAIGLTVASLQWLPKGLYLLLILGFGIVVQLQIPLFEHALKPYVNKVAA